MHACYCVNALRLCGKCIRSHAATDITGQVLYPKEPQIEKFSPYTEHATCAWLVPTSVCPPPLEKEAVSPMHTGYPHHRNGGCRQVNRGHNFFFLILKNEIENKNRRNKESRKICKKENKNYIQQDRIGITLKEHPGRVDLPVSHYSPDGQSAREMALGIGH